MTSAAAAAGPAILWLLKKTLDERHVPWITAVGIPAVLACYSVFAAPATGVNLVSWPAVLGFVLAIVSGLMFKQHDSHNAAPEQSQPLRNLAPLLLWGAGALLYVFAPALGGLVDALSGAVLAVGGGALAGQAVNWAAQRLVVQRPVGATGFTLPVVTSDSRIRRYGGFIAAALAVWLLLPSVRGGVGAPANSLLVGTSALANETVYILDLASGNYRPLDVRGGRAHWSPDGTRMALTRKEGALMQLWVANADGSNLRRLTDVPGDVVDCFWSSDSQRIYFLHGKSFLQSGLSAIHKDGGTPEEILPVSEAVSFPMISPDGRTLAYHRSTDFSAGRVAPPKQIKLFDLGTRQSTVLMSQPTRDWNVTALAWTPDGQALVFATQPDAKEPSSLEQLNVANRQRKVIADRLPYRLYSFTWVSHSALAILAYPIRSGASAKGEIWLVDPATGSRKKLETSQTVNAVSIHASPGSATGHRTVEIDGAPASQRPIQSQPPNDQPRGVPPAPPLGR